MPSERRRAPCTASASTASARAAHRRAGHRGRQLLARRRRDPRRRRRVRQRQDHDGARAARLHASRGALRAAARSRSAASTSRPRRARAPRPPRPRRSYVPQDPGGALNPSLRVGDAILDVLRAHRAGEGSLESVHSALDRVELGGDRGFTRRYPHQLSGGQQQRVDDRDGVVCEPPVAVLDEPTTGLDVLTQDRILSELGRLRGEQTWRWSTCPMTSPSSRGWPTASSSCTRPRRRGRTRGRGLARPRHPYTRRSSRRSPISASRARCAASRASSVGVGEWPRGLRRSRRAATTREPPATRRCRRSPRPRPATPCAAAAGSEIAAAEREPPPTACAGGARGGRAAARGLRARGALRARRATRPACRCVVRHRARRVRRAGRRVGQRQDDDRAAASRACTCRPAGTIRFGGAPLAGAARARRSTRGAGSRSCSRTPTSR